MNTILGEYRAHWRRRVSDAVSTLCTEGEPITERQIIIQNTNSADLGDIAFPLFPFAKRSAMSPTELAERVRQLIDDDPDYRWGRPQVASGYLNIYLNRADIAARLLHHDREWEISNAIVDSPLASQKICVEYSSPNTNKPLHLGHLRNNVLGASLARILAHCGATVTRINLINDRGVHICKSMAAYQRFADGAVPSDVGARPDTFVGDYYVRFSQWEREDPTVTKIAQQLLVKWEEGDEAIRRLWRTMRQWVLDGIKQTYRRTDIDFDLYQYESDLYLYGKQIVQNGLDSGVFHAAADGSVEIDLSDVKLGTKTLLRADGTAIYVTQDLGTVVRRYRELDFDRLIYVVANEQEYHFKVLFEIIARLKLPFASRLFHRSYGIVQLPDGRMKSREGTVVDADALIDEVRDAVSREMQSENRYRRRHSDAEKQDIAERIAIASIHYWLMKFDAHKNITFDTEGSISFSGNSGAYILYTIARLHHLLLHGATTDDNSGTNADDSGTNADDNSAGGMPTSDTEWQLLFLIAQFQQVISDAGQAYSPFPVAQYLYRLAHTFSRYYHDVPIAVEKDRALKRARLRLVRRLLLVFERCCYFLVMPTVTNM